MCFPRIQLSCTITCAYHKPCYAVLMIINRFNSALDNDATDGFIFDIVEPAMK